MTTMELTEHRLKNGDRETVFTGTPLASASSRGGQNKDALRWFEVHIFKTEAGFYVVQKIGRSRVTHAIDGCEAKEAATWTAGGLLDAEDTWPDDLLNDLAPCPICTPLSVEHYDDWPEVQLKVEGDRTHVVVCENAAALISAAHSRGREEDERPYLTKVAVRALREAAVKDKPLYDEFMVERVA